VNNNYSSELNEETADDFMFVTISLDGDRYGINVQNIQEIIGVPETAHVPNTMPYMKGVTSLRGKVIPLVDLRIKFNLAEKEYDKLTVVLIAEIQENLIGFIVDSVSDVISVPLVEIQNTPHFSTNIDPDCIYGACKLEEEILIIIDIEKIFRDDELLSISQQET